MERSDDAAVLRTTKRLVEHAREVVGSYAGWRRRAPIR